MRLARRLGSALTPPEAAPAAMTVAVMGPGQSQPRRLFEPALMIIAPVAMLAITLLLMAFIRVQRQMCETVCCA